MDATKSSHYIPLEILFDILIKLPVKTLIRFQCVSKSIQAMITDPTFISTHRDRSCAANNHSDDRYVIKLISNLKTRFCLSSHVDDDQQLGVVDENVLQLPDELLGSDNWHMNMTGSCHNLLCFTAKQYQEDFSCNTYLWNPSIRVVNKLPDSNSLRHPPELCGIGFDSRTNDYKVVQVIHGFQTARCRVYSLSTNSWRWIESCPTLYPSFDLFQGYYKQSCTFWKDCLYWIAREFILNFNVSGEIFEIISLPSNKIFKYQGVVHTANFGLIKESLALFVECLHEGMNIWELKKELLEGGGIGFSWSKLFSIEEWIYGCPYNLGLCSLHETLIQRYKNRNWYYLGVWDFREHKLKKLGIKIPGFATDVYPYSESLVLLNQFRS